jgi:hypothetical protein
MRATEPLTRERVLSGVPEALVFHNGYVADERKALRHQVRESFEIGLGSSTRYVRTRTPALIVPA